MGEKQFKCTQCDKTFENTAVLCNNTGLTLEKSHLSALNVVQVLWYSTVFKLRGSELKETNCSKLKIKFHTLKKILLHRKQA